MTHDNNALAQELEACAVNCAFCNGAGDDGHGNKCWQCDGQGAVWPVRTKVLAALRTPAPASGEVVDLVIERAEQACRYVLKHNEDSQEGEYASGFAVACEVCEGAISRHVKEHIAADMLERLTGPVEEWREIEQRQQPRISEGYTAVKISKPGFWFVKGPGPATAYSTPTKQPGQYPWENWQNCPIGSCQRHGKCMYFQCRAPAPVQQPGDQDQVERVAKAMRPTLFNGRADEEVGPATLHARNETRDLARAAIAAMQPGSGDALHIVFDGPPGPTAGRFVEVETPDGRSVNVGEWHERSDGFWELRIPAPPTDTGEG